MMDEYWDDDTVFFVFEDDFRFENDPSIDAFAEEAASSASTSSWARRDVEVKKGQKRVKGQWFEIPQRSEPGSGRRRIDDLMHYMIQAYKKGCGNIVWVSGESPQLALEASQKP